MKALLFLILLTSCGRVDRAITAWTGGLTYKCTEHGVQYVQSDSGLAVSLHRDGSPVGCANE
jgi:hypothetical protein